MMMMIGLNQHAFEVARTFGVFCVAPCSMLVAWSRREWASDGNPCQKKLPFDVWLVLVAHGSTFDVDAQAVLRDCVQYEAPAMLELSVNKVRALSLER